MSSRATRTGCSIASSRGRPPRALIPHPLLRYRTRAGSMYQDTGYDLIDRVRTVDDHASCELQEVGWIAPRWGARRRAVERLDFDAIRALDAERWDRAHAPVSLGGACALCPSVSACSTCVAGSGTGALILSTRPRPQRGRSRHQRRGPDRVRGARWPFSAGLMRCRSSRPTRWPSWLVTLASRTASTRSSCFEGLEHLPDLGQCGRIGSRARRGGACRVIASLPNSKTFGEDDPFHVTAPDFSVALQAFERLPGAAVWLPVRRGGVADPLRERRRRSTGG